MVFFLGFRDDVPKILDSLDLFVLSSYLEGMGFGLPAIATTAGGASEIITNGVNGFLVPPADPLALKDRILQLAGDRGLLAEMSLAALERYRGHPTWEQSAHRIRSFLVDFAESWERE